MVMLDVSFVQANTGTSNEISLISAARQGDQESFNLLVLSYQDQIYNLAVRILGDEDTASDVTQNTFLTAYLNLPRFRNGSFRIWLYRIATNACYDVFRKYKRHPTQSIEDMDLTVENLAPQDSFSSTSVQPEIEIERRELVQVVRSALYLLDVDQRAVLILVDQQEFEYLEAAHILGIALGTLKSRLARARLRLRDILRIYGIHADVHPTMRAN
jgi:RNA polymerase sigma-70 factor, ECF subfamily